MIYSRGPIKLHDCHDCGPGTDSELFIVEGDSASKSVARARAASFQAVLPMQGKPLNAWKASRNAILDNQWYAALIAALGLDSLGDDSRKSRATREDQLIHNSSHLDFIRYGRIVLLFDPDADGIHCGALLSMFLLRWMRPIIEAQRVRIVRAPMFEITAAGYKDQLYAFHEEHYRAVRRHLAEKGITEIKTQRYRGLASLDESTLKSMCLDPDTRSDSVLTIEDAEDAVRVFCG